LKLSSNLFERYQQEMRLRNYAKNTVKVYSSVLRAYVSWIHPMHPREASGKQIRGFQLDCIEQGLSPAYLSQVVSALKVLYLELYGWKEVDFSVPRPRLPKKLPYVPTREEILRMADSTENRKHRMAILLLYGSGLRVSELVALEKRDVNLETLTVFVRQAKGAKDRHTLLAGSLVEELRWLGGDRPRHARLFTARGGAWSVRSVQHVVPRCGRRAGVKERVTPHSLRHAFATHLLENGVDLLVIQSFLGHAKLSTTARYIHMRDPSRLDVLSPL
jgi:site-specific recombinase XerD